MRLFYFKENMTLETIIEMFEKAPRLGIDKDEPEGSRYVILSDTLANEIVDHLKFLIAPLY